MIFRNPLIVRYLFQIHETYERGVMSPPISRWRMSGSGGNDDVFSSGTVCSLVS